jgi:parallel beta-helix repeat protein
MIRFLSLFLFCFALHGQANRSITLSVLDFGAKGNGTTDDTDAIRAAISKCPAGSTIKFPAGTYMVKKATTEALLISKSVSIVGEGPTSTFIRSGTGIAADDDIIRIYPPSNNTCDFIRIENICIGSSGGTTSPGRHAIYLDGSESGIAKLLIKNVYIGPHGGYAIYSTGNDANGSPFTSTIEDSQFYGGVHFEQMGDSSVISRCKFNGENTGIFIDQLCQYISPELTALNIYGGSSLITIQDNNITSKGYGIHLRNAWSPSLLRNNIERYNGGSGAEAIDTGTYPGNCQVYLEGTDTNAVLNARIEGNMIAAQITTMDCLVLKWTQGTRIVGNDIRIGYKTGVFGITVGSQAVDTKIGANEINTGYPPSPWQAFKNSGKNTTFNGFSLSAVDFNVLTSEADNMLAESYPLQSAIQWCASNNVPLHFPAGTYYFSQNPLLVTNLNNLTMFGDGPSTILQYVNFNIPNAITFSNCYNLELRDMTLIGGIADNAVVFENVNHSRISNIGVRRGAVYGMVVSHCNDSIFSDIKSDANDVGYSGFLGDVTAEPTTAGLYVGNFYANGITYNCIFNNLHLEMLRDTGTYPGFHELVVDHAQHNIFNGGTIQAISMASLSTYNIINSVEYKTSKGGYTDAGTANGYFELFDRDGTPTGTSLYGGITVARGVVAQSFKASTLPPIYANNAAAKSGGLVAGQFYRTSADPSGLCVVY